MNNPFKVVDIKDELVTTDRSHLLKMYVFPSLARYKQIMEKLSAEQIDKELTEKDDRKPVRKVMDDAVIPAASVLAAGVIGTVGALGNVKENQRLHKID